MGGEDDDRVAGELLAPRDTPGAKLEQEAAHAAAPTGEQPRTSAATARKPPTVQEAARLLAAGHVDEAIRALYLVRRHNPRSAEAALLLGHAYFHHLWRSDGLREYAVALKLYPPYRHNQLLLRNAVAALDDPTYRLARALIRVRIGVAALPEVRRAARDGKNAKVHQRAAALAISLTRGGRLRR
jgi:hypothetical protein